MMKNTPTFIGSATQPSENGRAIKCRKRSHKADVRRQLEQHPVGPLGHQVFLGDQLQPVGQQLQPAELTAGARGAQPILNARRNLALHPHEKHGAQKRHQQQQRTLNQAGHQIGEPGPQTLIDEKLGHRK